MTRSVTNRPYFNLSDRIAYCIINGSKILQFQVLGSKLDCKISRRAQSALKRKNPTPSVGNQVEHFFWILTSEFRAFYLYLLSFNLFIFHAFQVLRRDPFNRNSNRSDREMWSTSKGGPVFSKLFRLDRTDPLSFGPKFPEILVEWIAPHGLFVFPPKKTLMRRRHCSISQSCCSMASKRSID